MIKSFFKVIHYIDLQDRNYTGLNERFQYPLTNDPLIALFSGWRLPSHTVKFPIKFMKKEVMFMNSKCYTSVPMILTPPAF